MRFSRQLKCQSCSVELTTPCGLLGIYQRLGEASSRLKISRYHNSEKPSAKFSFRLKTDDKKQQEEDDINILTIRKNKT